MASSVSVNDPIWLTLINIELPACRAIASCSRFVLVTSKSWPQREELLRKVEEVLASLPSRHAYYPGSDKKYQRFLEAHPDAHVLTERAEGTVPWTTIFGVDSQESDNIVFCEEAWCAVLAETALEVSEPDRAPESINIDSKRIAFRAPHQLKKSHLQKRTWSSQSRIWNLEHQNRY